PVAPAPAPATPVTSISDLVAPEAPVAATLPAPIPVRPEASPAAPAPVATASRPAPVPAAVPPLASVPAAPDPAQQRYAAIQRALNKLGYGPVEEDGFGGGETADAIRRFELDNGLPI